MSKISKSDFEERFGNLPKELRTKSQGKVYRNICVKGGKVCGIKESGNSFNISISSLYEAYENDDYYSTSALANNYNIGRNGAPAKAILDFVLDYNDSFVRTSTKKNHPQSDIINGGVEECKSRKDSDEAYVIDLCDEVLKTKASRQHRFPFLLGDGANPTRLPVDAYYKELNLVVEYYELQHTESVSFFDKPEKMTVSGVPRGEQRKIYDQRRREVLPKHDISLVIFNYTDFLYDSSKNKRLIRNHANDIKIVREKLEKYLKNCKSDA